MPRIPFREAVFAALHLRLQVAFPEMTGESAIERNPKDEVASDARLPLLRCYDMGHTQGPAPAVGEEAYRFEWVVEGFVEAESAPDAPRLDAAMNGLHARLIEAMMPAETAIHVPLASGILEIDPQATVFDVDRNGAAVTQRASVRFTQSFAFQVWTNRGNAYVETL